MTIITQATPSRVVNGFIAQLYPGGVVLPVHTSLYSLCKHAQSLKFEPKVHIRVCVESSILNRSKQYYTLTQCAEK